MKTLRFLLIVLFNVMAGSLLAQGNYVYVSDAANFTSGDFKIVQFDTTGDNPVVYIDSELAWPQDVVFLEDQNVAIVSNLNSGRITKYNAANGNYIEDFAQVTGGPTRMKIGDDGFLYVLQWSNTINKVLRFQLDGTPMGEFTDVGVIQSIGMDWDDDGNLYVSSFAGGTVRKFDSSGNDQGIFINSNLSGPTNIEIKDGVMYVLDWNAGKCVRFDASNGNYIDDFITTLTNPEGLAFLPNGTILIGDNGTNSVRQFDPNGNDLGDYTNGGNLITPNAVVLRDELFLSVETELLDTVFVAPTVGNQFSFRPNIAIDITSISIYSMQGNLVTTIDPQEISFWNAGTKNEGIYFMVATLESGQKITQKIVVEK